MHVERMICYQRIDSYNWDTEMRLQRRDVEIAHRLREMKFILYER